jgi:hypothetical protein
MGMVFTPLLFLLFFNLAYGKTDQPANRRISAESWAKWDEKSGNRSFSPCSNPEFLPMLNPP